MKILSRDEVKNSVPIKDEIVDDVVVFTCETTCAEVRYLKKFQRIRYQHWINYTRTHGKFDDVFSLVLLTLMTRRTGEKRRD